MRLLFTLLLISYFPLQNFAQKSIFIEPCVSYVTPIAQVELRELGIGYFPFSYTRKPHFNFGVNTGIQLRKWKLGLGFSYKNWNQAYSYTLFNSTNPEIVFEQRNEQINYTLLAFSFNTEINISERFSVFASLELNDPIQTTRTAPGYRNGILLYAGTVDEELSLFFLAKDEFTTLSGSPYSHGFIKLKVKYKVGDYCSVHIGIIKNILRKTELVRLNLTGQTPEYDEGMVSWPLNNTVINSDFFGLSFGLSKSFQLHKWNSKRNQ